MTQSQHSSALLVAQRLRHRANTESTPGNLDTLSAAGANEIERLHARVLELESERTHGITGAAAQELAT